ncbi:MAG: hypothetical protein IJG51_00545 [Synergistaceae bacterium]|nr:hypothetical protein [Synergistaceae bacterium]MBQ3397357.1 hypothetical protein [Synergistaceae bacterium]MBQ3760280.1 hypothetical protein [Synergistaceae bacterium]MBQ6113872.1 hypothetical protein [Synergistaceae bacterium]MBQ6665302.1 hypothetical protein [Synergistaceae bacterium]
MKALRIFLALCLIVPAISAWGAENQRGEVLAVLKTPAGMTLTKESLKSGRVYKYIKLTADSAGAEVVSIFDSLSLMNKDGHIFVFMVSDSKSSEQLASDLKSDPNVVSASPNRKVGLPRPVK